MAFDPSKIASQVEAFDPHSIAKPVEFTPSEIATPEKSPMPKRILEAAMGRPVRKALGLDIESAFEPKKTIGQLAESYSERTADNTSQSVPGVPVRESFVRERQKNLLTTGKVVQEPGITQRVDASILSDDEFLNRVQRVESALQSTSQEERDQNILSTLKGGAQSTARSIGSYVSLLSGDTQSAENFQAQERAAMKSPEVSRIMQDIESRTQALGDDASWTDTIKAVGASFAWDPQGAAHLITEQMPNSLVPLATGIAGFTAGGPVGGVAGLFAGNIALESGFRSLEKFGEETSKEILKKGAIKGSVIGAVDTATIGLTSYIMNGTRRAVESATRKALINAGVQAGDAQALKAALLNPIVKQQVQVAQIAAMQASQSFYRRVIRGGSGTILETLGEGTGDYLGSLAADGEASKVEAVIEAFSSLGSSAVTTGAIAAYNQTKTGEIATQNSYVESSKDNVQRDLTNPVQEMEVYSTKPLKVEPLTAEELQQAEIQEKNLEVELSTIPDDPATVEDIQGLEESLLSPIFKQPQNTLKEIEQVTLEDSDAGISPEVTQRRLTEEFPGMVPLSERRIGYSSVPEQVGLSLTKVKVQPDTVVAIGGNTDYFSSAYTQALGDTLRDWQKEFMPVGERIVLNLAGFQGDEVGAYQQLESGIHVISPRELPRSALSEVQTKDGVTIGQGERSGFNSFTQQQTFGALTHEFGHAVIMSRFNVRMPQELRNVTGILDSGKVLSQDQLNSIPEEERAVIQDYQERKQRILSGEMPATELMENWLGTWKQAKDILRKPQNRQLEAFAQQRLEEDVKLGILEKKPFEQYTALELIHAMGRQTELQSQKNSKNETVFKKLSPTPQQIEKSNKDAEKYLLQFSEFMAEQFSRYAATRNIENNTALGRYFAQALKALKDFFKKMKTKTGLSGERVIQPGTSFETWMKLGQEPQVFRKMRQEQKKNKKQKTTPKVPKVPSTQELMAEVIAELKQEELELSKQMETPLDRVKPLNRDKRSAQNLELAGDILLRTDEVIPDTTDKTRVKIEDLIRQERYIEADEELTQYIMRTMKFDREQAQSERQRNSQLFFDKDSQDAQTVEKVLNKIGEKAQASWWKKAINWTKDAKHYVLQVQQLAHESTDAGTLAFNQYQNNLLALKNNLLQKGTEVADQWENLSKKDYKIFSKLLIDEFESRQHFTTLLQDTYTGEYRHAIGIDFLDYLKRQGLDTNAKKTQQLSQLLIEYKNTILEHIEKTEQIGGEILRDKYRKAPLVLKKKLYELQEMAQKWRETPYMPQGNFGEYVVKVYDDTPNGKQLIYKTHFENAADQDAMIAQLKKRRIKLDNIEWGKLSSETGMRANLPAEFLGILKETGEFSSEQLKSIGEAMVPLPVDKIFSKVARDAVKIAGASTDHLRNYANWIEDSANFLSKLAYGRKMTKARLITKEEMESLKASGNIEESRNKQKLYDTMTSAQEFIMHPLEEWYQARSYVALTYLMWAPKTALLNLTGMMQTWAAVTADYGDIKGNALMAGVTKDLVTNNFTQDEQWVRDKALQDGIIDQGFGYFMSGLANAGNLARRVRPTLMGKALRNFVDLGMWPFKAVEIANRQMTLMSVYRGEYEILLKDGLPPEDAMRKAYEKASRFTRLLQNDYANGNRPEVLRGKKSILMIFLSYPQYMLWIMSGGFERGTRVAQLRNGGTPRSRMGGMTMRMWILFALLAGVEGVPFGEFMIDVMQRLHKWLGGTDNIRLEGQKFLKETMGIESRYWRDVVQRGFLHDVMGVDLSGSLSLGSPLPGLRLVDPHARNWQEFVGEAFAELSGPFGGVTKAPIALGLSDDPTLGDYGKSLPGAAGAVFKALEAEKRGIRTAQRARILRDDAGNFREPTKAELALLASGFRLSDVARYQNLAFMQKERKEYWGGRRTGLKQQYRRAVEDQDTDLQDDVLKEVDKYNEEIPNRSLFLSFKELRQFVRTSKRAIQKIERNQHSQRDRDLFRDVQDIIE